jgi:hypothetical protein
LRRAHHRAKDFSASISLIKNLIDNQTEANENSRVHCYFAFWWVKRCTPTEMSQPMKTRLLFMVIICVALIACGGGASTAVPAVGVENTTLQVPPQVSVVTPN